MQIREADQLPRTICLECWQKIDTFHAFHRSVQSAQSNYLVKFVKHEFVEPDQTNIESDPINPYENEDDIKMPSFVEVPQIDHQHYNEFQSDFQEMKPTQIGDTFFAEVMFDPGKRESKSNSFIHTKLIVARRITSKFKFKKKNDSFQTMM